MPKIRSMKDSTKNQIYANAFNLIPELGPVKLGKIFANTGSLGDVWDLASTTDYINFGIDQKTAFIIMERKKSINPQQAYEELNRYGIKILLKSDDAYPKLLTEIPNPPPILYVRGRIACLNNFMLAVVGTRKVTPYGKQAILNLVPELAQRHINVVSGLAFGVDALALECSLDLGTQPVAVLATSLADSSISPRSNYALAQRIISQGAIVSEYPLGSQVQKQNFPVRNRLISGMAVGTLVIEADEKSGALITANYALEQNRNVFAVPGSIFSQTSRGPNNLIKKGARMVTSTADIIEELNIDLQIEKSPVTVKASTAEERLVLEVLTNQATSVDDIIRQTKLPPAKANVALSMLELAGRIKNLGNSTYAKII